MCPKMDFKPSVLLFFLRNVLCSALDEGSPCMLKDGAEGICLKLSDCYHAKEDLRQFVLPQFCSYNVWKPTVCCLDCRFIQNRFFDGISFKASVDIQLEVLVSNTAKVNQKQCHEAFLQHFPCNKYEHFKDLDDRVICYDSPYATADFVTEGYDATRNSYPHLALIGYGDDPYHAHWICSGAIISIKYILCAAHCTRSVLGKIKFAAMGIQKKTDDRSNWQIYEVVKIIVHPGYQPPSTYHDIALLETATNIRYNYKVIPACLHRWQDMPGVAAATGWSAKIRRQPLANILKDVEIHQFHNQHCMEFYPKHRNLVHGFNSTTQVCYGDEEHINDTCEGDSGGPLQIRTNMRHSKCLYTIVGITSYGRACGQFGSSGLFTRIAHYVPWIESITGK